MDDLIKYRFDMAEEKLRSSMSFIDSYKSLEKLCSEIYDDNHGVSSYIDEMVNNSLGSRYVRSWDEDLKQLKHYRWVRNQIVHEPNCSEENMCEYGDSEWIDNFHSRIMSGTDPLSQYRKAKNPQPTLKTNQTHAPEPRPHTYPQHTRVSQRSAGCLMFVIGFLVVITAVILITGII